MEKEIAAFENISRTGNQVLDTILAAKIFHCRKKSYTDYLCGRWKIIGSYACNRYMFYIWKCFG